MSLRNKVLNFVNAVRKQPVLGSDPGALDSLQKCAQDDWTGFIGALHAPIAPLTWEVRAPLARTTQETGRKPFTFPYQAEIVGMRPVVLALGGPGAVPTADDIEVSMDLSDVYNLTSTQGDNANGTAADGTFVTLAAIGVQVPRLMMFRPDGIQPQIGFKFRWAVFPPPAGPSNFQDCLIKISMFSRRIYVPTK